METTLNRPYDEPLSGVRQSTNEMVFSDPCVQEGLETDDRRVPAYSECSIRFTRRMFELNGMDPITAYVNTPLEVLCFKESCTSGSCETEVLFKGVDHYQEYNEDVEVRFIFENDSAKDQVFQIAYIGADHDLIYGAATSSLVISTFFATCLSMMALA